MWWWWWWRWIIYLKPVVGPRTELQQAELFVERKVSNVHFAGAEQFCGHRPEHVAEVGDHCIGRHQSVRILRSAAVSSIMQTESWCWHWNTAALRLFRSGVTRNFRQRVRWSVAFLPMPIILCWSTQYTPTLQNISVKSKYGLCARFV